MPSAIRHIVHIVFSIAFLCERHVVAQQAPEEFLASLIREKSYSGQENNVTSLLEKWAVERNFFVKRLGVEGHENIAISRFPLDRKKQNIVLTSHLDVVPVIDSTVWRQSPFGGEIVNDTIWGRGAIDCKGLAIMQLYALEQFCKLSVDTSWNITFLGLVEEEDQSVNGAAWMEQFGLELLNPAVILGEGGSGMTGIIPSKPNVPVFGISTADKSSLWLRVEARNRLFGHSSIPSESSANRRLIKALLEIVEEKKTRDFHPLVKSMFRNLGRWEGGMKGFVIRHINWHLFKPLVKKQFEEGTIFYTLTNNTISITQLSSNSLVTNQSSDKATAILDCRLLPETDVEKFIRKLKRTTFFRVQIEPIYASPQAKPSEEGVFFNALTSAIQQHLPEAKTAPFLFPATTDNNFFRRNNIPVYGLIPAVLTNELLESVHSSNERIAVSSLYDGIQVYVSFLQEVINPTAP